jgi:hypothetical protein
MTTGPLVFTNSELRVWQICKRKWYLGTYLGYAQNPALEPATGVMHLGSSIHLALQSWYGYGIDPVAALDWAYSRDMLAYPNEAEALDKELSLARVMTEGYCDWVSAEGIDSGLEILGVEEVIETQLEIAGQTVMLRGKLDQLARRESDGALLARDYKTTGSLSQATKLRFSSQLRYYALVQAINAKNTGKGELVAGGEYLLIVRSKRTNRASPPFYERVGVPLNRHDLSSEWLKTKAIVTEIIEARMRLDDGEDHHSVVYPNWGDHCSWGCPFVQLCPLFDDGSRAFEMLKANFVKQDSLYYYDDDRIELLRAALS